MNDDRETRKSKPGAPDMSLEDELHSEAGESSAGEPQKKKCKEDRESTELGGPTPEPPDTDRD